jgi:SAM-dependent methyltransferase
MNARILRLLYEVLSRVGLNPALTAADVPDTRLVELVEGPHRLEPGRALDLGCGAGRNTRYLAQHGWDVTGIDIVGAAIDKARSTAVGDAANARFLHGDVTRLADLDLGLDLDEGYDLVVDSGCYYGLPAGQRDAYATGVTRAAAPGALLLMAGFTKVPGIWLGSGDDELRARFPGWELNTSAAVPIEEIMRHTRIPFPLKLAMRTGRLQIRRFELSKT